MAVLGAAGAAVEADSVIEYPLFENVYVYSSRAPWALVPCGVTTVTSTVVVPAGAVAVIWVGEFTV